MGVVGYGRYPLFVRARHVQRCVKKMSSLWMCYTQICPRFECRYEHTILTCVYCVLTLNARTGRGVYVCEREGGGVGVCVCGVCVGVGGYVGWGGCGGVFVCVFLFCFYFCFWFICLFVCLFLSQSLKFTLVKLFSTVLFFLEKKNRSNSTISLAWDS